MICVTEIKNNYMSQELTTSSFQDAEKRMTELGMDVTKVKKEISFALQIINKSPKLKECTPVSKLAAVVNVANIGLTLNPVAKEACLVPRWNSTLRVNECSLEPMYPGLVKLLTDAGSVKSISAQIVYENDKITIDKADNVNPIRHNPELISSKKGQIIGVYAIATLIDGTRQVEWMDKEETDLIKQRSETYQAFMQGKIKSATWSTDEAEMMRKTVIKRIYKYLPRTERMEKVDNAISLDNTDYAASDHQLSYIESLLHTSTLEQRQIENIELEMSVMNAKRASEVIDNLLANQQHDSLKSVQTEARRAIASA